MLGNSSFSLNGAVPKITPSPTQAGLLQGLTLPSSAIQAPKVDLGNSAPGTPGGFDRAPTVGTNPGLIQPTNNSINQSLKKDVAGNEYHAPKPNENVLAQQKELNKLGAGLVEDGIIGDKTRAAIAKYAGQMGGGSTTDTTKTDVPETPKPPAPPAPPTQSGIISGIVDASNASNDPNSRLSKAYEEKQNLQNEFAKESGAIQGTPIPLEFQQGRGQVLANQYGTRLSAAETGISNALTGNSQKITGLLGAAGVNAPITGVPYGTQTINPQTGLPINSSGVTVDPNNPASSIPSLVDAVVNGQMTIDQANSALGGNIGLTTNLRNAILQKNPAFNFVQSSSSSTTQALGQQLKANVESANKALDTLTTSFNSLPSVQTGGIPLTNSIAQWIGAQFGQGALSQYLTNLHDARSQLVGVLNSSGGTPTGNEATAESYLPDNMTKAQFDANVGTPEKPGIVRELMNQKLTSFSGSGSQNASGGSTGGSFGWDALNQ